MKRLLCYVLLTAVLLAGCGNTVQTETERPEESTLSSIATSPENSQPEAPTNAITPESTEPEMPSAATTPEDTEPEAPTNATTPEDTKPEAPTNATTPETTVPELDPLMAYLDNMTLRQKVGQLFVVEPEQLPGYVNHQEGLSQYPVGGVILFAEHIHSPEQLRSLIGQLQAASDIPLFISVDEEGGRVARLANNEAFGLPKYESAGAVGSSGNTDDALKMGQTIGGYLKEYGINLNFAPVADVNTNPNNPIIGERAFSSDPVIAGKMARAFADGLNENQVAATFKHFPGHGDTAEDSHLELAMSNKTLEELRACEWLPFQKAGRSDMVMVGHIALPQVAGDMTPATMSDTIIKDHLRGELGFAGLVVTDALNMAAVTRQYSSGEAALNALQAGCDILLMPEDFQEAYDAVLAAVEEGTLSTQWLDETVGRILQFKADHGILTF